MAEIVKATKEQASEIARLIMMAMTDDYCLHFCGEGYGLEEYLAAAKNVGSESVKNEPGVICLFPNQLKDDCTMFRIVEIYRDQAAYQHHLTTPHFQAYKQGTLHMVKSLNLLDINPLDSEAMSLIFRKQ